MEYSIIVLIGCFCYLFILRLCIRSNLWNRFQSAHYFGNDTLVSHESEYIESESTETGTSFIQVVPTESALSNSVSFVQATSLHANPSRSVSLSIPRIDSTTHSYSGEVTFRPSESGLGNNLLGLASAFVIAAVTNKRLYTTGNYAYDVAFKVTDHWNMTVEHKRTKGSSKGRFVVYNNCFSPKSSFVKRLLSNPIRSIFDAKDISLSTNCPLFLFMLQNEENRKVLLSLGLLSNATANPPQYDYEAFFLYSSFLRNHLFLSKSIRTRIDNLLAIRGDRRLLCMHIRCGVPLADFPDQATFLNKKDIHKFHSCQNRFNWSSNAMILVASDSSRAKMMIRNYNPQKEVFWWVNKTTHTMTRYYRQTARAVVESSVFDLFSLASCDAMIGTFRSTYSLTAAALIGEVPYLVSRGSSACTIPKVITFG